MKTILLVDDESSMLVTLAANLELEDYEVLEASSGEQALEIAAGRQLDIVLSDIRMPGMTGVELARRIRVLQPDVPIVLMTAFALEGLVQEALDEGVFGIVSKPFQIDQLVATLAVAVRRPVVVVVDDEAAVADATVAALGACGIRARAVFEGAAALAAVATGTADVVIVDLVMPGMDGREVIARVHDLDDSIACIAVSGHDMPMLLQGAAPRVFAMLRKPVTPRTLAVTIAQARVRGLSR